MAAVIEPVTAAYDIYLNIIKGGCSESFVWQISQAWEPIQKPIFAYYLGDHDPSGLAIERDLRSRLEEMLGFPFCTRDNFDGSSPVVWHRLALTDVDFRRTDLLGFPIKGDRSKQAWQTRHRDYLRQYGDRCVEVDAIPAREIRQRIQEAIEWHIEHGEWKALQAIEAIERQSFKEFMLAQKVAADGGDRNV